MMNALNLSQRSATTWRGKKAEPPRVVGPLYTSTLDGKVSQTSEDAVLLMDDKKKDLLVWTESKGTKTLKKVNSKLMRNAIYCVTDNCITGIFYFYKKGSLGFATIEHDQSNPYVLKNKGACENHNEYLQELLSIISSSSPEQAVFSTLSVRRAELKKTQAGFIAAAVISTASGQVYLLTGILEEKKWKLFSLESFLTTQPCIYIASDGSEVKVVRCDITPPVDKECSVLSPTIPIALSLFDRTFLDQPDALPEGDRKQDVSCVVFREKSFKVKEEKVVDRVFQSQCFVLQEINYTYPYQCFVEVNKLTPVFSIIVPCQTFCSLLHLSFKEGGEEVMSSATILDEVSGALSMISVELKCAARPSGTMITIVVSDSLDLLACETFGNLINVKVNGKSNSTKNLELESEAKQSASFIRLVSLPSENKLLYTTGAHAAIMEMNDVFLSDALPERVCLVEESSRVAKVDQDEKARGVVLSTLEESLRRFDEVRKLDSPLDRTVTVFQLLLPQIRYVGSSQEEIFLIQRIFKRLLEVVSPSTEEEWSVLWSLTLVVQRILTKRCRENKLAFTDAFFTQLYDAFKNSTFKTEETLKMVGETVSSYVSPEIKEVVREMDNKRSAPEEVQFILEGLSMGEPIIPFAEEVIRQMVETNTLSNGACVVRTKQNLGSCVHAVGAVLLLSCLDVPVFLYCNDENQIRWSFSDNHIGSIHIPVFSFLDKSEFCLALTLATDLLSIPSDDESFRPDVAIYALALCHRFHCLTAFISLFASTIKSEVSDLEPFSVNRAFLENASSHLGNSYEESIKNAFLVSSNIPLSICAVICGAGSRLNVKLFKFLINSLPESFCTSILTSFILYTCNRLISAQNNYSAAVMKLLVACDNDEHRMIALGGVEVCQKRLESVKADVRLLWAQFNLLSPYKIEDIALSYLSSIEVSLGRSHYNKSSNGTTVSKCIVMCYRLYLLIEFVAMWESKLDELISSDEIDETRSDRTEEDPVIFNCLQALQGILTLRSSPLPIEWLQLKFIRVVEQLSCTFCRKAEWKSFLLSLLESSHIGEATISCVKKAYFELFDRVKGIILNEANRNDKIFAYAQSLRAKAEYISNTLQFLSTQSAPHYIFASKYDETVPSFPQSNELNERKYLLNSDWMNELNTIELHSDLLKEVCSLTVKQIIHYKLETEEDLLPDERVLSRPLYEHICQLVPPIRTFASVKMSPTIKKEETGTKNTVDSDFSRLFGTNMDESRYRSKDEQKQSELKKTNLIYPLMKETLSLVRQDETPSSAMHAPPGVKAQNAIYDEQSETSYLTTSRDNSNIGCVDQIEEVIDKRADVIKPRSGGMFSPRAIAWWENKGEISMGKDTDDLSDSATSFTTSTSADSTLVDHAKGLSREKELYKRENDHKTSETSRRRKKKGHCACGKRQSKAQKNDVAADRVKLLEFNSKLKPPDEVKVSYSHEPNLFHKSNANIHPLPTSTGATNDRIQLLTFSKNTVSRPPSFLGAAKDECVSKKSHVSLFPFSTESTSSASAAVGVRYLEPPKLPSSSVLRAPPPLLHLAGKDIQNADDRFPRNQCFDDRVGGSSFPFDEQRRFTNDSHYNQVPRAPRSPVPPEAVRFGTESERFHNGEDYYTKAPIVSGTYPGKEPILDAQEKVNFREYTDALLAGKVPNVEIPARLPIAEPQVDVSLPLPTFNSEGKTEGTLSPVLINSNGVDNGVPSGYTNLLMQHNFFLDKAESLMNSREKENDAFYKRVSDTVRTLTEATLALRGESGLSPSDQSELLRNSIKQKNELLNLNRDLMDLQLSAARAGDPAAFNVSNQGGRDFSSPFRGDLEANRLGITGTNRSRTDLGIDPISSQYSTDPQSAKSIENAMVDLHRLNDYLHGMNTSAEAMEKAIRETRESIKRFEDQESMEKLNAEGAAMLNALRHRTAAAERRLSELPRSSASPGITKADSADGNKTFHSAQLNASEPRRSWIESSSTEVNHTNNNSSNRAGRSGSVFEYSESVPLQSSPTGEWQGRERPELSSLLSPKNSSRQFESIQSRSLDVDAEVPRSDIGSEKFSELFERRESVVAFDNAPMSTLDSSAKIDYADKLLMGAAPAAEREVGRRSKRPSVVEFSEVPSLRSPTKVNFADQLEAVDKPVFFSGKRGSLKDVYDSSARRPSEMAPRRSILSPQSAQRKRRASSVSVSNPSEVPRRFSMYLSSPQRKQAAATQRGAQVSSFTDLYDAARPSTFSNSAVLSPSFARASKRNSLRYVDEINRRISTLEQEFA